MKKPHAQWLTVLKTDIDPDTSIEILWRTAPNTLHLVLFRFDHSGDRTRLLTQEIGPYRSLAELHDQLHRLFGKACAARVCHPSPWLPAAIPVTSAPSAALRPAPSRSSTRQLASNH